MNQQVPSPRAVAAFKGYRWLGLLMPLGALLYTFFTGSFGSLRTLLWLPLGVAVLGGMVYGAALIWMLSKRTIKRQIAAGLVGALLLPLPMFFPASNLQQPDAIQWYGLLFFIISLPFWLFPSRLKKRIGPASPYETMRLID